MPATVIVPLLKPRTEGAPCATPGATSAAAMTDTTASTPTRIMRLVFRVDTWSPLVLTGGPLDERHAVLQIARGQYLDCQAMSRHADVRSTGTLHRRGFRTTPKDAPLLRDRVPRARAGRSPGSRRGTYRP